VPLVKLPIQDPQVLKEIQVELERQDKQRTQVPLEHRVKLETQERQDKLQTQVPLEHRETLGLQA
jgi:hypothetical protein